MHLVEDKQIEQPPTDFFDGYDQPVIVFCDSPLCQYTRVAEYREIIASLDYWMSGDARPWSEIYAERWGEEKQSAKYNEVRQ